jgi:hypothetical protein
MTAVSRGTKRKLSLLQLAAEPATSPKDCRLIGYHRDSIYDIRRAFRSGDWVAETGDRVLDVVAHSSVHQGAAGPRRREARLVRLSRERLAA